MKAVTVVGARPQFIKAAMVSRILGDREVLVHTGQHYDRGMSDVFFDGLDIPEPKYNLQVGSGSHGWQTGLMLIEIEKVLKVERPDVVIVYGDTNSTLAGALAAVKLHIPVAHVEAGLRSHNLKMPEEVNRKMVDHISQHLFVPTEAAWDNLKRESATGNAYMVGDVMYDAVLHFARYPRPGHLMKGDYILATIHRAENTDDPDRLHQILTALDGLGRKVIVPMHPRTRKVLSHNYDICITNPVGYQTMLCLIKGADVVVTDSGGLQKESYFLKVPCVTVRPETEWVELVDAGWNQLVEPEGIAKAVEDAAPGSDVNYGHGHAAERIVKILEREVGRVIK